MRVLPENPVKAPDRPSPPAHPARLILILSLAPIVGLGIGRFAYSLVLPDMRDSLGWSYSAAGFMNTINAAGYLAGALLAAKLIKRFGLSAAVRWGTLACVASLALSALSGNFIVLSFARLLVGFGAAFAFVGGAALTSDFIKNRPDVAKRFTAAWEKAVKLINENPAEARKHLVKNTFTPDDVVDTVPMIRYFMAKDLTAKDKADYQKFIDFSVKTGTLEQPVDVTKYLQAF